MAAQTAGGLACPRCEIADMEYLPRMRSQAGSDWYRCDHCNYLVAIDAAASSGVAGTAMTLAAVAATAAMVGGLVLGRRTELAAAD